MEAGRDLDLIIADKIFGISLTDRLTGKSKPVSSSEVLAYMIDLSVIPNFSTDMKDSWDVVEKIVHPEVVSSWHFSIRVDPWPHVYHAKFSNGGGHYLAAEDSAPHAICLAALAAKGIGF